MDGQDDINGGMSPTTRLLTMPAHANADGDIFGGWILSQMDIAGAIVAHEAAQGRIVTVAMDSVKFHKPVFIGDVVSVYAKIEKIGRTSITVAIEVYSDRCPAERVKVTEAKIVYVAIDEDRKPRPVRKD